MAGIDMAKIAFGDRQPSCFDQIKEDIHPSGSTTCLESENYKLKQLVVRLSATIIKNAMNAK